MSYTRNTEGESSKVAKERNIKGNNSKPTCHNCGKKVDTANVCRSKTTNQNVKPKNMTYCHKCNKKGHQKHECRTRTMHIQGFEGYFYN